MPPTLHQLEHGLKFPPVALHNRMHTLLETCSSASTVVVKMSKRAAAVQLTADNAEEQDDIVEEVS